MTPLIRPLDPQPPEGAFYAQTFNYTKIRLIVFTNPPGRYRETGIPAPFTPADLEGHEVKVMRLHEVDPRIFKPEDWMQGAGAGIQWVYEFRSHWGPDRVGSNNPAHPWDSNPWVAVLNVGGM